MDQRRVQRVSETLKEELAEIIEYEMTDPRIGSVAVTGVMVTPDLRMAHVRVVLGADDRENRETSLEALQSARNFIRRQLATRLRLWRVPEVQFEEESAGDPVSRVDELLKRIKKTRTKTEAKPEAKA
jgi:ribosome-binding factor A